MCPDLGPGCPPRPLPCRTDASTARDTRPHPRQRAAEPRLQINGAYQSRGPSPPSEAVIPTEQSAGCHLTGRSWHSPYDDTFFSAARALDIDHLVPLAEAWDSGASGWTTARRQAFANDLTRPQLIAVTDNVNQAKGDQDPATWMPSVTSYRCTYVRAWVQVKYYYGLSVDSAEKSALTSYLANC